MTFFDIILEIIITFIAILVAVAYFTLSERKIMGSIQRRKGPNIIGFWGLLQPLADAVKLIIKEIIIPQKANSFFFLISPIFTLFIALNNFTNFQK